MNIFWTVVLITGIAGIGGIGLSGLIGELLPESILMWRSKAPAFAMLVGLLVGVIILYL